MHRAEGFRIFLIVRQDPWRLFSFVPCNNNHEYGLARRLPGRAVPVSNESWDLFAGNHRLGGNICLTVPLSQGDVPPTGRLCQCGAAGESGSSLVASGDVRTNWTNGRAEEWFFGV